MSDGSTVPSASETPGNAGPTAGLFEKLLAHADSRWAMRRALAAVAERRAVPGEPSGSALVDRVVAQARQRELLSDELGLVGVALAKEPGVRIRGGDGGSA